VRAEVIRTIAGKELWVALHRRSTALTLLLFPLLVALGLSAVLRYSGIGAGRVPASVVPGLLDAFLFFFVVGAAILPTAIAAYSLVGEKVERSLEPLLATPVSEGEILLAKSLAAFLPSIGATWIGAVLFMTLADLTTRTELGHAYFPNTSAAIMLLVLAPLASWLGVGVSVLVSARAVDVRTAQQVGALPSLPFAALYVAAEVGAIRLDWVSLVIVCVVLVAAVVGLLVAARATFNREEILTRWK
jgi:ABC-2 type transport system permease protein